MATAGYVNDIEISEDGATSWTKVTKCLSSSMAMSRAMLDTTSFGDSAVNQIAGLFSSDVPIEVHYAHADTAHALLIAKWQAGADIWVRQRYNGTHGFSIRCIVADVNFNPDVTDTAKVSFSLKGQAAPALVTP